MSGCFFLKHGVEYDVDTYYVAIGTFIKVRQFLSLTPIRFRAINRSMICNHIALLLLFYTETCWIASSADLWGWGDTLDAERVRKDSAARTPLRVKNLTFVCAGHRQRHHLECTTPPISSEKFYFPPETFITLNGYFLTHTLYPMAMPGMGGAKSPKLLNPTVKHTGQESEGELCEIFKFWSFMQSKYVNNVCKLLYFWVISFPSLPTGTLLLNLTGGLLSPGSSGYSSPNKNSWCRHCPRPPSQDF